MSGSRPPFASAPPRSGNGQGEEPDRALIARTAGGERAAFTHLVGRHQGAVYRLARALTPNPEHAEEVLQEACIAAWRGARTYRGAGSVRSWMLTLTRNAALRHQRRRAGEPAHMLPLDEIGAHAGWGPEQLVARLQTRGEVHRALSSLAPEDQEVLILRELEGFTGLEIARMLDLSLSAVKSRLHRARLRLVAALRVESSAKY